MTFLEKVRLFDACVRTPNVRAAVDAHLGTTASEMRLAALHGSACLEMTRTLVDHLGISPAEAAEVVGEVVVARSRSLDRLEGPRWGVVPRWQFTELGDTPDGEWEIAFPPVLR